jgi:hypothetical protein
MEKFYRRLTLRLTQHLPTALAGEAGKRFVPTAHPQIFLSQNSLYDRNEGP